MDRILVTGSSGFIGMHLCKSLLEDNVEVAGIDNMNDYYDVSLKKSRLNELKTYNNFNFFCIDIQNKTEIEKVFKDFKPEYVVNLAAQAGVRYSLRNPQVYIDTNVLGFINVLECCKNFSVKGLVYASSSSVYGGDKKIPFSVQDRVDKPISIYAASKKANELMAYSYSHLYNLKTTGLRFFTVYGPWGRPDMAMYIFTKKISENLPIDVFNHGKMSRDYTFVDDIVGGIRASISKNYKCEVFNLGNSQSEGLLDMIKIIEENLGKKAILNLKEMQPGDVETTFADIEYSTEMLKYKPTTCIHEGIPKFISWYKKYNKY